MSILLRMNNLISLSGVAPNLNQIPYSRMETVSKGKNSTPFKSVTEQKNCTREDSKGRFKRDIHKSRSKSPKHQSPYSLFDSQRSYSRPRSRSPCRRDGRTKCWKSESRSKSKTSIHREIISHRYKCISGSRSPSPHSIQYARDYYSRSSKHAPTSKEHENYHRSRSRSKSHTRSKRNQSRSRSSSPLSMPKKTQESDTDIEKFIVEERLLMEKMDNEKKKFVNEPERHPDYEGEWKQFYTTKCNQYGPMHQSYLQEDWAVAWKTYFFNSHESLIRRERKLLLSKHKIFDFDVKRYKEKRLIQEKKANESKDSIDRKDTRREHFSPKNLAGSAIPSTSKEHIVIRLSPSPPNQFDRESLMNTPNPTPVILEEDNICEAGKKSPALQTLRLLSVIENDLGYLGAKINQFLMRANAVELSNSGEDITASLLGDSEFGHFLSSCKSVLSKKLSKSLSLTENKTRAYIASIEHIHKLLDLVRSRDSLRKQNSNLGQHSEEMIKSKIEKKVIEEFNKAGRIIQNDEKIRLVEAEYQRILPHLNKELGITISNQNTNSSKNEDPPKMLHQSLGLSKNCVDIQNIGQYDQIRSNQGVSGNKDNQIVKKIDWKELQKVVETISRNESDVRMNPNVASTSGKMSKTAISEVSKNENDIEIIDDDIVVLDHIKPQEDITCLDELTFNDLVNLCTNIKNLDTKTKADLIDYIKKLEKTNPSKVQELKRYLNME